MTDLGRGLALNSTVVLLQPYLGLVQEAALDLDVTFYTYKETKNNKKSMSQLCLSRRQHSHTSTILTDSRLTLLHLFATGTRKILNLK